MDAGAPTLHPGQWALLAQPPPPCLAPRPFSAAAPLPAPRVARVPRDRSRRLPRRWKRLPLRRGQTRPPAAPVGPPNMRVRPLDPTPATRLPARRRHRHCPAVGAERSSTTTNTTEPHLSRLRLVRHARPCTARRGPRRWRRHTPVSMCGGNGEDGREGLVGWWVDGSGVRRTRRLGGSKTRWLEDSEAW